MKRTPATDSPVGRRYNHDLAVWRAWHKYQARLRRLADRALDTLEESLDAGGPEAQKAAALILRKAATTKEPAPPNLLDLALMEDDQLLEAGIFEEVEE